MDVYSVKNQMSPGRGSAAGLGAAYPAPPTPQQSFPVLRPLLQRGTVGQAAPGATCCSAEAAKNEEQGAGHYKRGEK